MRFSARLEYLYRCSKVFFDADPEKRQIECRNISRSKYMMFLYFDELFDTQHVELFKTSTYDITISSRKYRALRK